MTTIQTANIDHLPAIVTLLADDPLGSARETASTIITQPYLRAFEEIQQDPNAQILVALNGQKVVACLQLNVLANLTFTGAKRALIEGVRVEKAMQGRGIGRQIFDAAIAISKEQGCVMVQLTTNNARPDAAKFYQKLGFVGSHTGFKMLLK